MEEKKQQFHLEPDRGLLNDPNGLAYYKGKYYVFFQWNRFSKDHSYKEWGMFTSADMVRWTFEGSALLPDQTYDMCGIYSGSGLVINDRLYLFYTGNVKKDGRRESHQCMAVTENGKKFLKLGSIAETPPGFTSHFRDPKVFRAGAGGYCMVTGAQRENGKGALALFRSDDALSWTYAGTPALSEDYEMIECPDLFRLDGRYVLLYCPQNRDNENDRDIASFSAAKLVEFDEQSGMLNDGDLDQDFFRPDYGFDFYAPQTFEDGKGRRILYAWMSRMDSEQERIFSEGDPRIHCLTIPRELHLRNGKLVQLPVSELDELKRKPITVRRTGNRTADIHPSGRGYYTEFSNTEPEKELSVLINDGEAALTWLPGEHTIRFTRTSWVTGEQESRECPAGELRDAQIWCDCSSVEIFLNGGEIVFSSRIMPGSSVPGLMISGISDSAEINACNIESI